MVARVVSCPVGIGTKTYLRNDEHLIESDITKASTSKDILSGGKVVIGRKQASKGAEAKLSTMFYITNNELEEIRLQDL